MRFPHIFWVQWNNFVFSSQTMAWSLWFSPQNFSCEHQSIRVCLCPAASTCMPWHWVFWWMMLPRYPHFCPGWRQTHSQTCLKVSPACHSHPNPRLPCQTSVYLRRSAEGVSSPVLLPPTRVLPDVMVCSQLAVRSRDVTLWLRQNNKIQLGSSFCTSAAVQVFLLLCHHSGNVAWTCVGVWGRRALDEQYCHFGKHNMRNNK